MGWIAEVVNLKKFRRLLLGDSMKVKLNDVKVTKLNGTCLTLIAKFSRVLRDHNGVVLNLSDPGIVREVISQASETSNPQLRRLCNMLIREIRAHLSGSQHNEISYSMYQKSENISPKQANQSGHS